MLTRRMLQTTVLSIVNNLKNKTGVTSAVSGCGKIQKIYGVVVVTIKVFDSELGQTFLLVEFAMQCVC